MQYSKGDLLLVTEEKFGTYLVRFEDTDYGWIHGSYICLSGVHFENFAPKDRGAFLPSATVIRLSI